MLLPCCPAVPLSQVLNSQANIQSDLDALEAAQEACVAAARDCAKQQQPSAHHTSSSSRPQQAGAAGAAARTASGPGMLALRHQLDKAYLAACKANEWREMTEVRGSACRTVVDSSWVIAFGHSSCQCRVAPSALSPDTHSFCGTAADIGYVT